MDMVKEEIPEDISSFSEALETSEGSSKQANSIANLLTDDEKKYFISEVKKRPELWSLRHPDHANRAKRRASWDEIAVMFTRPDRVLTGSDMLNVYKNFKDTTTRIFRRLRTKPGFNVHWPFFQDMEFIINNLPDDEKSELLEKYQKLKGYTPELLNIPPSDSSSNASVTSAPSWEASIASLVKTQAYNIDSSVAPVPSRPSLHVSPLSGPLSAVMFPSVGEKPTRKRRSSNQLPTMVPIKRDHDILSPVQGSVSNIQPTVLVSPSSSSTSQVIHDGKTMLSPVEKDKNETKRDRFDQFGDLVASTMKEIFNRGLQEESFKMKREIHDIIEKYEEKFLFNKQ